MKEHIYSTDEYEVKIGDPVVDAEVKATSTSVAIPCAAIPDGEYLISLEINGTAVAHRDTFSFASGSATVGDYTLAYSSYAVTVSTTSNNDVVRLKIEPVEVYVTDAMKAAVAKVAPKSEGGGSGGGVLVVNFTSPNNFPKEASSTFDEIKAAYDSGATVLARVDVNGSQLSPIGHTDAQPGVLEQFYATVFQVAATKAFICAVAIDSANTVTSTQTHSIQYDT